MSGAGPEPPELPESWTGERRVTVDLDSPSVLDVAAAWSVLETEGAARVEGRVSSGGDGVHLRAWFDADTLDSWAVEKIRLHAGDDVNRVVLDRTHGLKPHQILFTRKGDKKAGDWRTDRFRLTDDLLRSREGGL